MKFSINENILDKLSSANACFYANEKKQVYSDWMANLPVSEVLIADASDRLSRFAPLIEVLFPETRAAHGIIESPLVPIQNMQKAMHDRYGLADQGNMYLKMDSHLAVAGSVKARGGIYEVLNLAEELLIREAGWNIQNDYTDLAEPQYRQFFSGYTIQVGSTGNLGLSIGIMSARLGFNVIVHMSDDAKTWKKELLRSMGVKVVEYAGDYSRAVEHGRALSLEDPKSHFVDDENSIHLFLGYAVSAFRLKNQLNEMNLPVNAEHPLILYIPCGVGGAPGGITYGCKYIFGQHLYVYFIEPTQACCMMLGMATGKHNNISVREIGLTGKTEADGLAVGRSSGLVGRLMEPVLDGLFTTTDQSLFEFEKMLYEEESIFLEPSACAGFWGYRNIRNREMTGDYADITGMDNIAARAVHIVWATGGSLVPGFEQDEFLRD